MSAQQFISSMVLLFSLHAAAQSNDILTGADSNKLSEGSSHFAKYEPQLASPDINRLYKEGRKGSVVLGFTDNNIPVEAWFFPGTSDKKALIIAGVHGSELASIDVAKMIIAQLEVNGRPFYNVVIVPSLFPANAEKAKIKDTNTNFGRYTSDQHVDPNRQMPGLGQAFEDDNPVDACGRLIENENRYLLKLIQQYQPSRIASIHAIKDTSKAGVFADPRTDCDGIALGFESDSLLAITMSGFIQENGGDAPGNEYRKVPTALYYKDPPIAAPGTIQKRNFLGSKMNADRGAGVSLGSWASTAVCNEKMARDAIRILTVEFPGYHSYMQCINDTEMQKRFLNVYLYATAITSVFLDNIQAE